MCGTPADVFKHPINTRSHTKTLVHMHANKPKKKKSLYRNVTNCRAFIPAMIDP